MNKTTVKVLQEIIRSKFSVDSASKNLKKAKTTIYDCLSYLRKNDILNKNNRLKDNELTDAYKKLFLTYPYDFSFLTKNNLKILLMLNKNISFIDIIKRSRLSRFTVHQLLKDLRNRGFIDENNVLIHPPELLSLLKTIRKYKDNHFLKLPDTAVIIGSDEERNLIQATKETSLPLHLTAFSAIKSIVSPYNYYTTKKRTTVHDIFDDAKIISKSKREQLITALFYDKNRKKLKKDISYEKIINSKEFKTFKIENG